MNTAQRFVDFTERDKQTVAAMRAGRCPTCDQQLVGLRPLPGGGLTGGCPVHGWQQLNGDPPTSFECWVPR